MRDPNKVKSGPICDTVAVIVLKDSDDENALPDVLHEVQSPHTSDTIPTSSIKKFARPRGWYNQSEASSSEFFYQLLTTEKGARRIAYILSTWEEDETTSNFKAVSIVLISQNFHPKAFKEILLEISNDLRTPENTSTAELIRFLTDELIEEGSTIEIRTKTLNVELGFELSPVSPVTGKDVTVLFKLLGFRNVVKIIHALLSDCRIVLASSSLMRLSRCQNAILSLLYPFEYVHSCVTILPDSLAEVLESPTPFLIGVLTDFVTSFGDENIVVYLDNGEVHIPDHTEIHKSDDFYYDSLHRRLRDVMFTTTSQEDLAIPNEEKLDVDDFILDKKLRACFILYFAELLYGYQYYILYTRIKGNFEKKLTTSLTFHVGAFRGFRKLTDTMSSSLLKSVYFQTFILSRALPRRKHDLFDEISCLKELDQLIYKQKSSSYESRKIIEQVSSELIQKERYMEKCSVRKQEIFTKIFWRTGRNSAGSNNNIIHTVKPKMRNNVILQAMLPVVNTHVEYHANQFEAYAHRIEALRTCLGDIFESKVSFASKSLDAVKSSMRFAPLRIELCRLLNQKSSVQAILTDKQFDDLSLLMNAALQAECEEDKDGVVRSLMYLSSVYSRKLAQGIQQYMYTALQDHKVWKNQRFWTSCFYYEVHEMLFSEMLKKDRKITESLWCHTLRPCAMEMIDTDDNDQEELVKQENEMIQAQAKHFANLMICLQIPLTEEFFDHEESHAAVQGEKSKWIAYTLDSILGITGRINGLALSRIQNYVEAHVESMRDVYVELSTGEHAKKDNFDPILVCPSEYLLSDPIDCYMLANAEESSMSLNRLENLLPANGSLFLTNYRVIFKGKSVDINATNGTIVQTVPLFSVEATKKLSFKKQIPPQLTEKGVKIEHIIAIRSSCAATILVAFDEDEINNLAIEKFLEVIENNCHNSFAFYNLRKDVKVSDNSSHRFSTLNSAFRGFTKKKTETRRIRSHSSHRGSVQISFEKIEELDHLKKNAYIRYAIIDYPRLGLNSKTTKLRMSASNLDYNICPTYPGNFIVPSETNESEIAKVAKGFVEHRLPVVVWMNENGALLIRASAFTSADMVKKIKKVVNYRRAAPKLTGTMTGSQQTLHSKASSNEESASNIVAGAEIKSAEVQMNYFTKLANSSQRVLSYALPTQYADKKSVFNDGCTLSHHNGNSKRSSNALTITANGVPADRFLRKALYVILEKGNAIKIPTDANAEAIMVRSVKESELRRSLQKARQIYCKDAQNDSKISFLEAWGSSNWPQCVSRMLELSNSIVALMSLYNSSVAICLESGRSITTILSSLSQLLSDPFYRTIDGFRVLVEKEWLSFGHFFHKDAEMCSASFICFMDCVYQIMQQYPMAFEYTEFYIKFVAFHSASGFFRTFVDDCEEKRLQADANEFYLPDDLTTISIWEFIKIRVRVGTYFVNDVYEQYPDIIVPSSSVTQVRMWSFLTETNIRYGSPYDIDAAYHEQKLVDPDCEDDEDWSDLDSSEYQESFVKMKSNRNSQRMEKVKMLQKCFLVELFESSEKKNTSNGEVLGKETIHELSPFTIGARPVQCCYCANILTRWSKAVHCKKCRIHVHEGCVNRNITIGNILHTWEAKPLENVTMPSAAIQISTPLSEKVPYSPNHTLTRDSMSPPMSNKIPPLCTGYLSKRGAKLKLWVPRFFVLYQDTPKVYYYEDLENWKSLEKPSGSIDLVEFKSFSLEQTGRRGLIELHTKSKSYRLLAENMNEAIRWRECIEQVIRD